MVRVYHGYDRGSGHYREPAGDDIMGSSKPRPQHPKNMKIDRKYRPFLFLIPILAIGIFLRTYNFGDWVRFNDDQARDAALIRDVLSGTKPLPILGPNASGTRFRIGPMFYYFQYVSAKLFGNAPEALAYPDLLFSILTIPMLFLFLRRQFSDRISLPVTTLYALSYYAIEYSRFAWNPNSLPFFTLLFLYSLSRVAGNGRKAKPAWAALAGVALGVGIQLHTLFLLIAPIVLLVFFAASLRKEPGAWKMTAVTVAVALFLNIPQIYSETLTGGKNTGEFVSGIIEESTPLRLLGEYAAVDGVCQIRNNAMIVSSSGGLEDCHLAGFRSQLAEEEKAFGKLGGTIVFSGLFLGIIFSVGGYLLLFLRTRSETDPEKKRVLILVSTYAVTAFLIFIPFATEMTSRYFLVVQFIPFFFLGLWLQDVERRFGKAAAPFVAAAVVALSLMNLHSLRETFDSYRGADPEKVTAPESVTQEEIRSISGYILSRSKTSGTAYFHDRSGDMFGMAKGLSYFLEPAGLKTKPLNKGTEIGPTVPVFSIDLAKVSPEEESATEKTARKQLGDRSIVDHETFGRFTVYEFGKE